MCKCVPLDVAPQVAPPALLQHEAQPIVAVHKALLHSAQMIAVRSSACKYVIADDMWWIQIYAVLMGMIDEEKLILAWPFCVSKPDLPCYGRAVLMPGASSGS
jgi:hypothetical protein